MIIVDVTIMIVGSSIIVDMIYDYNDVEAADVVFFFSPRNGSTTHDSFGQKKPLVIQHGNWKSGDFLIVSGIFHGVSISATRF